MFLASLSRMVFPARHVPCKSFPQDLSRTACSLQVFPAPPVRCGSASFTRLTSFPKRMLRKDFSSDSSFRKDFSADSSLLMDFSADCRCKCKMLEWKRKKRAAFFRNCLVYDTVRAGNCFALWQTRRGPVRGQRAADRFYPVGFDAAVQTATKFEAFLRDFQRKNPSRTAKIARVSALECDFRKLQDTPLIGRVL